jgi:hypothetical protein
MTRIFTLVWLVGMAGLIGLSGPERILGFNQFTSIAEARVGRPLTPVSVAGVTRRTVRRCAAGVYNC